MKLFGRRKPAPAKPEPVAGERVFLRYDDGSKVEFNDFHDAFHHVKVLGSVGVTELCREADGAQLYSRPELDNQESI